MYQSILKHNLIRHYSSTMISILVTLFFVAVFFLFNIDNTTSTPAIVALVGIVFIAIQHDFRKKAFEFSLFNERFAIYSKVSEIACKINSSSKADQHDIQELSGDFLAKSHYLFSDSTYQFIKEVRENATLLKTYGKIKPAKKPNAEKTPGEEKKEEAIKFFITLQNIDYLESKFPELKMYPPSLLEIFSKKTSTQISESEAVPNTNQTTDNNG